MALVQYHDSESEDDDALPTPVDKMPPGVVSSGLGIPPSKPLSTEAYSIQLKNPVVHSAPLTSLVDYEHDEDAPDISLRENSVELEIHPNQENMDVELSEEEEQDEPTVARKARTVSLPSPPGERCTQEEQEVVIQKLNIKRTSGQSLNYYIQKRKDFRNPSIYEKLIQYFELDEFGTDFPKEVYDPHCWGEESYYTSLSKAQREHHARKQKEQLLLNKAQMEAKAVATVRPQPLSLPADKRRKSKWDQSGPSSSSSSPSVVGTQALINAQKQADLQKILDKK